MYHNSTKNKTLVFVCLSILFIYNTCTFLLNYYNFYVSVGLSLLFIILTMLFDYKWDMLFVGLMELLVIAILIYVFLSVKSHSDLIATYIASYWYIFFWSSSSIFIMRNFDKNTVQGFVNTNLCILLVSIVPAIIVLNKYPMASRDLAGMATEVERQLYQSKGAASFGFVYGIVVVFTSILEIILLKLVKSNRFIYLILLLCIGVLVLSSSYTIALIIMMVSPLLLIIILSKKQINRILGVVGILIVFLLYSSTLELLMDLAIKYNMGIFAYKFHILLDANKTGDYSGLSRASYYLISWKSFISNPLIGGNELGWHSFVLDHLAMLGVFIAVPFTFIGLRIKTYMQFINARILVPCLVCAGIIVFVNTFFATVQIAFVFFLAPLILYVSDDKKLIAPLRG